MYMNAQPLACNCAYVFMSIHTCVNCIPCCTHLSIVFLVTHSMQPKHQCAHDGTDGCTSGHCLPEAPPRRPAACVHCTGGYRTHHCWHSSVQVCVCVCVFTGGGMCICVYYIYVCMFCVSSSAFPVHIPPHHRPSPLRLLRNPSLLVHPDTLPLLCPALQQTGCCATSLLQSFAPAANISCVPGLWGALDQLPGACLGIGMPLDGGSSQDGCGVEQQGQHVLPVEQVMAEYACVGEQGNASVVRVHEEEGRWCT